MPKQRINHRNHRSGWLVSCGIASGERLRSHGVIRRSSSFNTGRIDHFYQDPHETNVKLKLVYGDLNDGSSLNRILRTVEPDEIYNLGANPMCVRSFDIPEYTGEVTALGTVRLLEADPRIGIKPEGSSIRPPRRNCTAKLSRRRSRRRRRSIRVSVRLCQGLRFLHHRQLSRMRTDLFACNGILFNHESARRGETFVTRKITRAATRIKLGLQSKLYLGNLEARRDWGLCRATTSRRCG